MLRQAVRGARSFCGRPGALSSCFCGHAPSTPPESPNERLEASVDLLPRPVERMRDAYRNNDLERVFESFDVKAFQGDCSDAEHMLGLLAAACGKGGDADMAKMVLERTKKSFTRVGYVTHASIIMAFCKQGKLKEAVDYLANSVPVHHRTDSMYNTVLAACVAEGNTVEFDRQLAQMRVAGCKETELTWVQKIRKASLVSSIETQMVWQSYVQSVGAAGYPCLSAYVCSLSRCNEGRKAAYALRELVALFPVGRESKEKFKWSRESHIRASFNAVLNCAKKAGDFELFKSVLHEMTEAEIKLDQYTYNMIAGLAFKAGGAKDLQAIVDQMVKSGIIPGGRIYHALLRARQKAGDLEAASRSWKQMMQFGVIPTAHNFNQILEGCIEDCESGAEIYNSMQSAGCRPDRCTFVALFQLVSKYGKKVGGDAMSAAAKKEPGWQMSRNVAHEHWRFAGDILRKWEKDMVEKNNIPHNEASLTALIQAYGRVRLADQAVRVLNEAVSSGGEPPGLNAYNSAIASAAREGKVGVSRKLMKDMQERGVGLSLETYNALLLGCSRQGGLKIMNVMGEIEAAGMKPDRVTYDVLIKMGCTRHQPQYGVKWLREMKRKGFEPSIESLTALISKLLTFGKHDLVSKVFELMDHEQRLHFAHTLSQVDQVE
ncbi:hypothetical protein BSKO_08932 [Bryopsis sp. KO-2023]|nr:hypothetical protein BSKO_08932 [Bryopsis sp. KO-2023]